MKAFLGINYFMTNNKVSTKKCSVSVYNGCTQNVDEHMVKFKGKSSMRQYVKNKTIK